MGEGTKKAIQQNLVGFIFCALGISTMSTRCHAMVGKRHAPNGTRRCNHDTARSKYCWQHLKEKEGLRIMKASHGMGVVTTKPRKKNEKFGTIGSFAQPSIRPNAKRVGEYLVATTDIRKNTEVTVPAAERVKKKARERSVSPVPPPKRKMKLIKPDHGEDPPELVFEPPPPSPKQPKKGSLAPKARAKAKPKTQADKHEIHFTKRIKALQVLWDDSDLAHELKIPRVKRVIDIPARGKQKINFKLEELYKAETKKWVKHVNKNPRNKMTFSKADYILQESTKRRRNN